MEKTALLLLAALAAPPRPPAETEPDERAEVLVLGTWHMANPGHDVFNLVADDVLAPRRQAEIAEVIEVLKRFRPTKIAVESDAYDQRVQQRYAEYLDGRTALTRNEIDQVGFRLARALGMKRVYPVDESGDFPMQRVANFARAKGRQKEWEEILAGFEAGVKRLGEHLKSHTVLETLLYANSAQPVAESVGLYHRTAHLGEPGDQAGPDLLASWYRRNVRIFGNIAALADSPRERILVVYGWGHLGWLRQSVAGDPSLRLRTLAELVPGPPGGPR